MRDICLARGRLIGPQGFLCNKGAAGVAYHSTRTATSGQGSISRRSKPVQESRSSSLRSESRTREENRGLVRRPAQSAGYSAQSFGLDGGGPDHGHRDARSETTTRKKRGCWRYGIDEQVEVMLRLAATLFGQRIALEHPVVEFGTGVTERVRSR